MITESMRILVDDILDRKQIAEADVQKLQRDILPDGATCQDEIDVLVALDRAVPQSCPLWAEWLVALTVDFTVWMCRPSGFVTRDQAHWLAATLSVGEGPSNTACRIAFEVVREAESCDEILVTFAMRNAAVPARSASTSMLDRAALVS
jgi:hypothetical protein